MVKGDNPQGYIVKYDSATQKFHTSDDNLLGIGKEGELGYIDQKVLVEIEDELRIFKKDIVLVNGNQATNGYAMMATPWLAGEEIKQFILVNDEATSNIYYINAGQDSAAVLSNALVVDEDGNISSSEDQFVLKDENDNVLVYNMEAGTIIPLISLKHLSDGSLQEENFTVVAAESNMPKLPSIFSKNHTFVNIFSNEIIFCSQEEMLNRFNNEVLLNRRFMFTLFNSMTAQ